VIERCTEPPIIVAWLIGLAIAPPYRGKNADYMTTTRAAIYARESRCSWRVTQTRSVFDRYNVVSDGDLRSAATQLAGLTGKVAPASQLDNSEVAR
jgi:hypothetical protein